VSYPTLLTVFILSLQQTVGMPIPGLDRESKMKLLESIFNDEEEGRNKVSNSINLHFTNPNMANMRMNKLPLDSNILNPLKGSTPLQNVHSKIEHPRLHQKVGLHNQQDEADEIIQNMFPNENMQQYSRITDVLKAVARDENLPYEKKKILFDAAFTLLPSTEKVSGKTTMVDILGALHKNLNEDEIPDKYKIASLLGSDLDDYAVLGDMMKNEEYDDDNEYEEAGESADEDDEYDDEEENDDEEEDEEEDDEEDDDGEESDEEENDDEEEGGEEEDGEEEDDDDDNAEEDSENKEEKKLPGQDYSDSVEEMPDDGEGDNNDESEGEDTEGDSVIQYEDDGADEEGEGDEGKEEGATEDEGEDEEDVTKGNEEVLSEVDEELAYDEQKAPADDEDEDEGDAYDYGDEDYEDEKR